MPATAMIVSWRDMVPDLAVLAPGLPTAAAVKFLRAGAVHYLKRTAVWEERMDPLFAFKDVIEYEVVPPTGSDAVIDTITFLEGWADFEFIHPNILRLGRYPSSEGKLSLRASLLPGETSKGLGEQLWVRHRDGIVHYATAAAYRVPGEPWFDMNLSAYHESCAHEEVVKARINKSRGDQSADMRVRPRRFI